MKTNRFLLLVAGVLIILATPAEARGRGGSQGGGQRGGQRAQTATGLQMSAGLQMSGPLNGSGPAPVAERLSDDDWKKMFVRKESAQ